MSSKFLKTGLATAAALAALVTAAPMAAQAQANGVTNCDAPGGRPARGPREVVRAGRTSEAPAR